MAENRLEDIKKSIADADLVLIGIGDGMQVKLQNMMEDERFHAKWDEITADDKYEWVIPYLIRYYLDLKYHPELVKAYENLSEIIADKNYFIISLSTDDIARKMNFKPERIVFPCGNYEKLQCADNCASELYDVESMDWSQICDYIENRKTLAELKQPVCPICGKPLVFNQYGEPNYNEKGYLDEWGQYTKWLQGTVNKKLCILELGVGMEFPSIIRWPFEKIMSYNLKCTFYRVHEMFCLMPDGLEKRGVAIQENPVKLLME